MNQRPVPIYLIHSAVRDSAIARKYPFYMLPGMLHLVKTRTGHAKKDYVFHAKDIGDGKMEYTIIAVGETPADDTIVAADVSVDIQDAQKELVERWGKSKSAKAKTLTRLIGWYTSAEEHDGWRELARAGGNIA